VGGLGQLVIQRVGRSLAMLLPSLQGTDGEVQEYYASAQSDIVMKRFKVRRGVPSAGAVAAEGGLDGHFAFEFMYPSVAAILERQKDAPRRDRKILAISDWQIGSPTMAPAVVVRALDHAIHQLGVDTIVLNGDLIHGQNYSRFPAESQRGGLIGIDSQVEYAMALLRPLLESRPQLELFVIPGNHEWNSQAQKGQQGTHFLRPVAALAEGYLGAERVHYVTNYCDGSGTLVDFPSTRLDAVQRDTGFGVLAPHLYGGEKGKDGPLSAAAFSHANWCRKRGEAVGDIDITLGGHLHTTSVVEQDGKLHIIPGGMAKQSGFEHLLGFDVGEPTAAVLHLSNKAYPRLELLTERYLAKQPIKGPPLVELIGEHGEGLDAWLERTRAEVSGRAGYDARQAPARSR
jgi:predicted phosphodiesterase